MNSADLGTAVTLLALAGADLLPSHISERAADLLARCHVALRGGRWPELRTLQLSNSGEKFLRQLEMEFQVGAYRELLYTVREYRGGSWDPDISTKGFEHLEAALDKGNGAIVWGWPCTYGGWIGKRSLHEAGFPVASLSSHSHPFSGSKFAMEHLNPVRTAIENQYLYERVVIDPTKKFLATRRLVELLKDNKVVEITAVGSGAKIASFDFLGGRLQLALGAPTISMLTGAALLPMATLPVDGCDDAFEVIVKPPLQVSEADIANKALAERLAGQYAQVVEAYVKQAPQVWRGLFNRANWIPDAAGAPVGFD